MFPDSTIFECSNSWELTLKGFLTHDDNSGNIHDGTVNKLFVALTKRNEMRQEEG